MGNILATFVGAFSYVNYYRIQLFRTLIIPFSVLLILTSAGMLFDIRGFWIVAWTILYYLVHIVFAVTTHRIILKGEESVPTWGLNRFTAREFRFFIYSIGIGFLLIPLALIAVIPYVGEVLALITIAYMLGRLSLVFPAIATDQNWSFKDSWVMSQNHQTTMAAVVVVFPFIMALPEMLFENVPYTEFPLAILSLFTTVFVVAALSVAFKLVRDNQ